jgi:hypothetical protein
MREIFNMDIRDPRFVLLVVTGEANAVWRFTKADFLDFALLTS